MKTAIFLSRPNTVEAQFVPGITQILRFMDGHQLDYRSIGTTVSPTGSPYQEMLDQMRACSGAMILGVPQLEATNGSFKGTPLSSPRVTATEWNHIEGTLALSLGKPTIVIAHRTVVGGIFDRGAFPVFGHSVDMANANWAWELSIAGALNTWISRLPSPGGTR